VADPRPTYSGPGRLLVAVYAVFAISASARAGVQIVDHFDDAPLAYLLSAFAAAVYVVATVALARSGPTARRIAYVACTVELVGVLLIGTASVIWPDAFPDETVWSTYGRGYGFVPLVLPVLGLLWLRRSRGNRQRRRDLREGV
jgi:cytochrome bd-type quinol oxidase subunit 2